VVGRRVLVRIGRSRGWASVFGGAVFVVNHRDTPAIGVGG